MLKLNLSSKASKLWLSEKTVIASNNCQSNCPVFIEMSSKLWNKIIKVILYQLVWTFWIFHYLLINSKIT